MQNRQQQTKSFLRLIRIIGLHILLKVTLLICRVEDRIFPDKKKSQRERVLIIVFGGMGDCLLFDPFFRRLKEQQNNVEIDVMTGCFQDMWQNIESIDNLIFFRHEKYKFPWSYFRLFRWLYRRGYKKTIEGLVMLPNRGTWGVITSLIMEASQAPVCIGRKTTGLPPYLTEFLPDFFYNNKNQVRGIRGFKPWPINRSIEPPPPKQRIRHEAFYIAEAMGVSFHKKSNEPYLCLDPLEKVKAELMLHRLKSGNRVVVGLVVETSYALKKWPDPFFAEIIERGTNENINFVLFGLNPFDVAVKNSQHLLNLTGKTSLAQMMAIISQCDFFLSADTGPAHIAQAYGVLTIVLFGPSNEQEFGPADLQFHSLVTPKETLPCRPCVLGPCVLDNSCMNLISVETVYSILQKRIKEIESKIVDHRLSHSQQIQQRIKAAEHCPQVIFEI